jgi:hypothetical protein
MEDLTKGYYKALDIPLVQGNPIKALCIETYKPLGGRLKKGDIVEVISNTYGADLLGEGRSEPYVIIPRGQFHSYFIRTSSGDEIPESLIHWPLGRYLTKDLTHKL